MRRLALVVVLAALGFAGGGVAAQSAFAATLCVGPGPGCYPTIQAAVDAAHDGDTVTIKPGTFAGGITITKSLNVVGTSAQMTVISGGGPVVTVGDPSGSGAPTVSIRRVTITGGLNESLPSPDSVKGGGVWIPAIAAKVVISDSIITGNRVAPQSAAFASGGGIDNFGTLTVTGTRITGNVVGSTVGFPSMAFQGRAGGVNNRPGATLTLRRSSVTGNRVAVTGPTGLLAVAGGISDFGGVLTVEDSVVNNNSVVMNSTSPGEVDSFTGGIEVTSDASATISRTIVNGNSVQGTNLGGDGVAGAGGISTDPDVTLVLKDSAVDNNSVSLAVSAPGAGGTAFAGGLEIEGNVSVRRCQFIGNEVHATTASGTIIVIAGGLETRSLVPLTVSDSIVADNRIEATTPDGFAAAAGGGIFNGGLLTLRRTSVLGNEVSGTAPAGVVQGGGIWNGPIPPADADGVVLTLVDSAVIGNRLIASPSVLPLGGGLFSADGFSLQPIPVTLVRTVIAGNSPDQCFGC